MPSDRAQGRPQAGPRPPGGQPAGLRGPGALKFAANLTLLYNEHAFLARFEAAAADGFDAVEFLFPYEYAPEAIAERLAAAGQQLVLMNAPPGDFAAGERGLACLPGREQDFRSGVELALRYATTLRCPRMHVMSGVGTDRATWLANMRWAAARAADAGVKVCIEPLNPRDMPGYFLNRQAQALELLAELDSPQVGLQFDLYHCQVTEGDVSTRLRRAMEAGVVAHVQVASAPGRHEPDEGELRVETVLALLDELDYAGHVGCEYRPRAGTSEGLGWLRAFGQR